MSFMEAQITKATDWVYIDTVNGGYFVLSSGFEIPEDDWDARVKAANLLGLDPKDIIGVGMQYGYGARLSAPGFLDCTDWTVHVTYDEAVEYLRENYDIGLDNPDLTC